LLSRDPLIGFFYFFHRAVARSDMHRLHLLEKREQVFGDRGIVATTLHLRNDLPLTAKVVLTFGHVAFGFLELFQQLGRRHWASYHWQQRSTKMSASEHGPREWDNQTAVPERDFESWPLGGQLLKRRDKLTQSHRLQQNRSQRLAAVGFRDAGIAHEDEAQVGLLEPSHSPERETMRVAGWHLNVDHGKIERLVGAEFAKRFSRGGNDNDVEPGQPEPFGDPSADSVIVFNEKNLAHDPTAH
jgi:hypothetical protein